MAGQISQAHLDAAAQQLGFRDYATWSAYQQHQQMMRTGPATAPQAAQPVPQQAAPQNWLQHLLGNIPGTPRLLNYVNDRMK